MELSASIFGVWLLSVVVFCLYVYWPTTWVGKRRQDTTLKLDTTKTTLEQANNLSRFLGHQMHAVNKSSTTIDGNQWVEFSVIVPIGTPRGLRTRWQMLKMFWKIMKGCV